MFYCEDISTKSKERGGKHGANTGIRQFQKQTLMEQRYMNFDREFKITTMKIFSELRRTMLFAIEYFC
jgi:hypothetical protein